MRPRIVISALAAALLLSACVRRPDGVLSDKEMVPVVADLELAEASMGTTQTYARDERSDALLEYVLRKHGVTREQFDSTMSWYGHNSDIYYEMLDKVERELALRKRQVAGNRSVEVESSDLWPFSRQSLISGLSGSDAFEFSVPVSDVERGGSVRLRFRLNSPTDAWALLGVEYDNGATGYVSRQLRAAKRLDMKIQTDSARTVSRIFGNMVVRDRSRLPLWLDSIYLSSVPFDSMEYYNIYSQREWRAPKSRRLPPRQEQDPDSLRTPGAEMPAVRPNHN